MTAVEWLLEELKKVHHPTEVMIMYAKKLEKQQIIDAWNDGDYAYFYSKKTGKDFADGTEYYNETYGSKGSVFLEGYEQINQDNPVTRGSTALVNVTSSQTEISDKSWEGCDGCTEQDEVMYKNGYVKGYNAAISELPKEISDEEIFKQSIKEMEESYGSGVYDSIDAHFRGAIWYREQLKQL